MAFVNTYITVIVREPVMLLHAFAPILSHALPFVFKIDLAPPLTHLAFYYVAKIFFATYCFPPTFL